MQQKQAILFKTHIWNDSLNKYLLELKSQIKSADLYIIFHDEKEEYSNDIHTDLREITICVTSSDIKSIYPSGFFDMMISNHWILMYFYQKYGTVYDYIWSMEYDIRISGDSNLIWNNKYEEDFLYTHGFYHNPKNIHYTKYTGSSTKLYQGYLQLARYSKKLLKLMDETFQTGENGQDELITYTIIFNNLDKITKSNHLLVPLIKGQWSWESKYGHLNYASFLKNNAKNTLGIYHPVKILM